MAAEKTTIVSPQTFDQLPGWSDDHLEDAQDTFHQHCKVRRSLPKDLAQPGFLAIFEKAILDLCNAFPNSQSPPDHDAARVFFEQNFQPIHVRTVTSQKHTNGFVTGYFQPEVKASLVRTETYSTPMLQWPQQSEITFSQSPWPTRAEIETNWQRLNLVPLVWLKDPVEAFFIHIQGSARLRFEDGTVRQLVYGGKNQHPYTSIGKTLIDRGEISRKDMTADTLKAWLYANKQAATMLMQKNASFIFFNLKETRDDDVLGGAQTPLTANRSLAVDTKLYPYGLPIFVSTDLSDISNDGQKFQRLMIAQDTGSAILGHGRFDIFTGVGKKAGQFAGDIKHPADVFLLLPKTIALTLIEDYWDSMSSNR